MTATGAQDGYSAPDTLATADAQARKHLPCRFTDSDGAGETLTAKKSKSPLLLPAAEPVKPSELYSHRFALRQGRLYIMMALHILLISIE